jgi:hypothetical protein
LKNKAKKEVRKMEKKNVVSLDEAIATAKRAQKDDKTAVAPLIEECHGLLLKYNEKEQQITDHVKETVCAIGGKDGVIDRIRTSLTTKLQGTYLSVGDFENYTFAGRSGSDVQAGRPRYISDEVCGFPEKVLGIINRDPKKKIEEHPIMEIIFPMDDKKNLLFMTSFSDYFEVYISSPMHNMYLKGEGYGSFKSYASIDPSICFNNDGRERGKVYVIPEYQVIGDLLDPEFASLRKLTSLNRNQKEWSEYISHLEHLIDDLPVLKERFDQLKVGIGSAGSMRLFSTREFIKNGKEIFEKAVAEYIMSNYSRKK